MLHIKSVYNIKGIV